MGHGHVYIEYPKRAKSTAIEYTQEVLRLTHEIIIFPVFFFIVQTTGFTSTYFQAHRVSI